MGGGKGHNRGGDYQEKNRDHVHLFLSLGNVAKDSRQHDSGGSLMRRCGRGFRDHVGATYPFAEGAVFAVDER